MKEKTKNVLNLAKKQAGKVAEKTQDTIDATKHAVVNVMDQNNDGTLDIKDTKIVKDRIANAIDEKKQEIDRAILKPLFRNELDDADFKYSRMIMITDPEKKYEKNKVAKGSIGFISYKGGMTVVNLFMEYIDELDLEFYPNKYGDIYYVDPTDEHKYIALDGYFDYMKTARIGELQKVAQDLGAKHFKVIQTEDESSIVNHETRHGGIAKVKIKNVNTSVSADKKSSSSSTTKSAIAAEASFPGKEPVKPTLQYLKNEAYVNNLISMRIDSPSPIEHQEFTLKLKNSSGIKKKDAVKIDSVLKSFKIAGNTSVASEVEKEAKRSFKYEIDF